MQTRCEDNDGGGWSNIPDCLICWFERLLIGADVMMSSDYQIWFLLSLSCRQATQNVQITGALIAIIPISMLMQFTLEVGRRMPSRRSLQDEGAAEQGQQQQAQ